MSVPNGEGSFQENEISNIYGGNALPGLDRLTESILDFVSRNECYIVSRNRLINGHDANANQ